MEDRSTTLTSSNQSQTAAQMSSKGSTTSQIKSKKYTGQQVNDHVSKYSGSRKSSVDTTTKDQNYYKLNHVRLENTFRLGPDDNKKFLAYKLYPNIYELLCEKVTQVEKLNPSGYNARSCVTLTRDLADSIRREAKNLSVPRYKIVVHVVVGENCGQDARVASRCLWNTDFDNCVSISHTTRFIWASVVIYVLYTE